MGIYAHRYAILFYTLLLTLAAAPLLTALRFSGDLLQIFLAFNLLVALLDVPSHRGRILLMLLAAIAVALRVAPASMVTHDVAVGAVAAVSVLALIAAIILVRFALGASAITAEHVYAAMSAYLLAGLFFGVLYWVIGVVWPGSLGEAGVTATTEPLRLSSAIYFSFVTLATVGYGDIVPRTELTRGLVVVQAVGGQLFIAVTIARLVAAQRSAVGPR